MKEEGLNEIVLSSSTNHENVSYRDLFQKSCIILDKLSKRSLSSLSQDILNQGLDPQFIQRVVSRLEHAKSSSKFFHIKD